MSKNKPVEKKKKGFKMPHLLVLMLGLIVFMSILTYIVPAGQFGTDANGNLLGDQFEFLPEQTPVSPWQATLLILQGIRNTGLIIGLLLVMGGSIGVILGTGAIDEVVSWAVYKLQDKGVKVLVPIIFFLIGIIGGFGGGDHMIAIVPIGLMVAAKLKLDPISAVGITFFPAFIGLGTGPTNLMIPQLMMDLPIYSGFGTRMIVMLICLAIGAIYLTRYSVKVSKNPSASLMGNTDWLDNIDNDEMKEVTLNPRALAATIVFILQYAVIVYFFMGLGKTHEYMLAVNLLASIVVAIIYGQSQEEYGNAFAKGASGMGFVAFIIGLASTMSLVMSNGNILHTIVYYATLPLKSLPVALSAIGISVVISVINVFIPSASGKAAILFPIIGPMSQALGMTPQLAVSAFQYGDGFTNLVSPALGATVGSLEIAGVSYGKWFKWVMPCVIAMFLVCMVVLYALGAIGWTGL
ncbi:MAG: AbgT family transporter [Tissierellaceae bacterium]|nr:AbgT family transporter [Tissierellaceae bacterium]